MFILVVTDFVADILTDFVTDFDIDFVRVPDIFPLKLVGLSYCH